MSEKVRFLKHVVALGKLKARVHYSHGEVRLKGTNVFIEAITLYAKRYEDGAVLKQLFPSNYSNNTDLQTDYSEKGLVRFYRHNDEFHNILELGYCN